MVIITVVTVQLPIFITVIIVIIVIVVIIVVLLIIVSDVLQNLEIHASCGILTCTWSIGSFMSFVT